MRSCGDVKKDVGRALALDLQALELVGCCISSRSELNGRVVKFRDGTERELKLSNKGKVQTERNRIKKMKNERV